MMTTAEQDVFVRKTIVVNAPPAHVFAVFTDRIDTWWPRDHHIGASKEFTAILEPRIRGRWYERGADGSECDWGRVLEWDPPRRVLLRWDISAEFRPDATIGSEVEVVFVAESAQRTRVELTHRHLERYGDKAQAMRAMFDSDGAWAATLQQMAKVAEP